MKKLLTLYQPVRSFLRKTQEDAVAAYSGQSALFILISFFPFIMFLLTLFQYLPFREADLRGLIPDAFPEMIGTFLDTIITELYHNSGGTLLSITVITALYSASRGMLAIIRGLNSVYHIQETRHYVKLRGMAILYTLALTVILILTLALLVFGNTLYQWCVAHFPQAMHYLFLIINARTLFAILMLFLFFWLLYIAIPNRRSHPFGELPGAAFAACGWVLFSYGYSYYIEHFSGYSYMYGSLTAVVLMMLWLYFCMYILFLGAEINVALQQKFPRKEK